LLGFVVLTDEKSSLKNGQCKRRVRALKKFLYVFLFCRGAIYRARANGNAIQEV
jgi:hypothetical protein